MSRRAASPATGEQMAALVAEDAAVLTASLARAPSDPRGVHEARKAVRRLRSVLALARDPLGEPARALDRQLRGIAKGLSALRDGQVVQETAASIARESQDSEDAANWRLIVDALAQRQARLLASTLEKDPGFARRQTQAHRHAERLGQLPWQNVHAADLRRALEKSARRQQRAQHAALASGQADDLHDWRRKSRRLRMQLNAMKKLRLRALPHGTQALPGSAKHITQLVDQLGALQDLELLHKALRALERERPPAATTLPTRHAAPVREQVLPLA
ncbi:CHAD domain-containing protein [Pseudoxanthomonas putridarboris]|uniref:CHAD domain-containing protein n=1 Tax=Pseudoxanthomonas putridarboris TaxID=752605 RepID=A0ABU9IWZ3_9GAMM